MTHPIHELRWIEAKNTGASDIPAFSVVEITGALMNDIGHLALEVQAPSADDVLPIAVCGILPIKAGKLGVVTMDGPTFCKYATADTPAFGESWGATSGSWRVHKDHVGVTIIGATDSTKEIVLVDFVKGGYKPIVDFTITAAMTTSDATKSATIQRQLGIGQDNPNTGAGEITVYNVREHTSGTYIYYGDSGDWGRAYHIGGNNYAIVEFECP